MKSEELVKAMVALKVEPFSIVLVNQDLIDMHVLGKTLMSMPDEAESRFEGVFFVPIAAEEGKSLAESFEVLSAQLLEDLGYVRKDRA